VTAVGDKAFVLKDGIWTDTTFDPTVMTTTQLPFPSDLFLEFLGDRPDAGKYFALGERVIVVLDGVAYETVEGDLAAYEAETTTSPQPSPQPQPGEAPIILTADVTEGVAPLEVNFTGILADRSEEAQVYACLTGQFEFGDGNSLAIMAAACDPKQERRDTANYVYDEPGEYQATYALGEIKSEPVTIIVKAAGDAQGAGDDPTPEPIGEQTATATPETVAVQAAPATPEPTAAPQTSAGVGSSPFNFWTFLVLPLLGLAAGWFIWGRTRNQ
jgi:hypothetical protein